MKKQFTIGAIAGASALVIATPFFVQLANAASGSSAGTSQQQSSGQSFDGKRGGHIGQNGLREEILTGSDAQKATSAALAAVPGGTVDRVETDAEGDAYEAHMTKPDGTPVTVKFDEAFNVTTIEEAPRYGMKTM